MAQVTQEIIDDLEDYIDRYGLTGIVDALSTICHEKAGHLLENWQDGNGAKSWTRDAKQPRADRAQAGKLKLSVYNPAPSA